MQHHQNLIRIISKGVPLTDNNSTAAISLHLNTDKTEILIICPPSLSAPVFPRHAGLPRNPSFKRLFLFAFQSGRRCDCSPSFHPRSAPEIGSSVSFRDAGKLGVTLSHAIKPAVIHLVFSPQFNSALLCFFFSFPHVCCFYF